MTAHNFQAPEVYVGSHVHGTSSEWFSAGITLHEFLTGRRPFEASKLQAFRYATANTLNNYSDSLRLEYMEQCDFLTPTCKEFVRELLMVDVRLSSKLHINFDYNAYYNYGWILFIAPLSLRLQTRLIGNQEASVAPRDGLVPVGTACQKDQLCGHPTSHYPRDGQRRSARLAYRLSTNRTASCSHDVSTSYEERRSQQRRHEKTRAAAHPSSVHRRVQAVYLQEVSKHR